jgi:hypothetical protein
VRVEEIGGEEEPILWILLTTEPIDEFEKALAVIDYYLGPLDNRGVAQSTEDRFVGPKAASLRRGSEWKLFWLSVQSSPGRYSNCENWLAEIGRCLQNGSSPMLRKRSWSRDTQS